MNKSTTDIATAVTLLILIGLIIVFGPIFTIWALNLLFATGIPVTFWTWLSVVWLQSLVLASKFKRKE